MSSLKLQVSELSSQLELKISSKDQKVIKDDLINISNRIEGYITPLSKLVLQFLVIQSILKSSPTYQSKCIEIKQNLITATECSKKFAEKWLTQNHKAREGEELGNLTISLESLNKRMQEALRNTWVEWSSNKKNEVALDEVLLNQQSLIPTMKDVCESFKLLTAELAKLLRDIPETEERISEIQSISEQLIVLREQMNFEVPGDVKLFLEHINNVHKSASLAMVTPDVFRWLSEQNLLEHYIVARGRA